MVQIMAKIYERVSPRKEGEFALVQTESEAYERIQQRRATGSG